MRLLLVGCRLLLAVLAAAAGEVAAQGVSGGNQPVRAFQQNTLPSSPEFAEGFIWYAYQKHQDIIERANEEAVRALSGQPAYLWTYPGGDTCLITTEASAPKGMQGRYLLIVRPWPTPPYSDCSKKRWPGAKGPSTGDDAWHSRYLFYLVQVTAMLREGAVDNTVSPDLTTACDLVCRGGTNCVQGPHMARFGDGTMRVLHDSTSRTTYVGSKLATSQFCAAITNLQAQLEASHVKYVNSLKLDKANRGACPEASFSNYPWFGKGEAARYATLRQISIPEFACLESARMDNSFPYQGMTRAELTLTLRFPVGRWASCFTDTPLRTPAECREQALPIGGSRTMRAAIQF